MNLQQLLDQAFTNLIAFWSFWPGMDHLLEQVQTVVDNWFVGHPQEAVKPVVKGTVADMVKAVFDAVILAEAGHPLLDAALKFSEPLVVNWLLAHGY